MARIAVKRIAEAEDPADILRWLDRSLIRLCAKFAQAPCAAACASPAPRPSSHTRSRPPPPLQYRKDNPTSFFCSRPTLRSSRSSCSTCGAASSCRCAGQQGSGGRGLPARPSSRACAVNPPPRAPPAPPPQTFNMSPDESCYNRLIFLRESVSNALVMMQPSLICYSFQAGPHPVLLDAASVRPDVVLLLDTFFHVLIFHGRDHRAVARGGVRGGSPSTRRSAPCCRCPRATRRPS